MEYEDRTLEDDLRYAQNVDAAYLNEQLNYFKDLIDTSCLPKEAKKLLFGLFDRTTVLSNYTDQDLRILLAMSDSVFAGIKIYMPPEKLTPDIERELENFRMLHFKMLRRGYLGFERKQQQTRITHATVERPDEEKKGGFLGGIFGR